MALLNFYVHVHACVYLCEFMCMMCVQAPAKPRKNARSPGSRVTMVCATM